MNQAKQVFNVKELSEYLQISSSSVRKLVRENSVPYFRILSKILFNKESIDLWLKNKEIKLLYPSINSFEIGDKYGTN